MMKKRWSLFWHIFVWLCLIAFFVFVVYSNNSKMTVRHVVILFGLYGVINISLFYLNYLLLIPKLLNRKRYLWYAVAIVASVVVYCFAKYGFALLFEAEVLRHKKEVLSFKQYMTSAVMVSLIFLFLSLLLKFATDWFLNERIQRDLENQRLTAELAFLKSQINPHFLFNSLNSIYSLAYQQSTSTPGAILKLSEIMRYMLYECNDNKVDLEKELQYLQNYIDLQKLRFGDNAHIDFRVNGVVGKQKIVPLLLIPFIENAFKHGVANDPLSPITLLIHLKDEHFNFFIQNKKHNNNRDSVGGIGLNNVRRRLDLLYPGKYNLDIHDGSDSYTCELSLVL